MNPTRRTAMHLLASTTLISMPAAVAMAAPQAADPDAGLVALYAEWQRLGELWIVEAEAKDPAETEYEALTPPLPPPLIRQPFENLEVGSAYVDLPNGRLRPIYGSLQVEALRAKPLPTRAVWVGTDEQCVSDDPAFHKAGWVRVPDAGMIARRAEIIEAYDAWVAEKQAIADRLGLTAARKRVQAIYQVQMDAERQIRGMAPAGLAGLRIKAQLARDVDDDAHAWQIVDDLLTMKSEVA